MQFQGLWHPKTFPSPYLTPSFINEFILLFSTESLRAYLVPGSVVLGRSPEESHGPALTETVF